MGNAVAAPQPLKSLMSMESAIPEVAKEGYMSLKTDFSGCFQMVYFKLWTNSLRMEYFYQDPNNEEPKCADLSEIYSFERVGKLQFAVSTSARKWEFQCTTE